MGRVVREAGWSNQSMFRSKMLGVTPAHVYKLAKAGQIPGVMRLSAKAIRFCPVILLPWFKAKIDGHGYLYGRGHGRRP
jgi:predicted DNA-binding transcriptional regulator AlpA